MRSQPSTPPQNSQPATVAKGSWSFVNQDRLGLSNLSFRFTISEYWQSLLLGTYFEYASGGAEFHRDFDWLLLLPLPTIYGRAVFAMNFTFRRFLYSWTSLSVHQLGLRSVVPLDADIIVACQKGDLLTVRELFRQNKARPTDLSIDNFSLLYVSLLEINQKSVQL